MLRRESLIFTAVLLLLSACGPTGAPAAPPEQEGDPPQLSPQEIAQGEEIYALHCASCHGEDLQGEADWKQQNEDGTFRSPPHTAEGHTWHHADSVLIEAIKQGGARYEGLNIGASSDMPAFGDVLSDQEIISVLTYIKSTWPVDIRRQQWQITIQSDRQ